MKLSVIIPTYNCASFIEKAINSIVKNRPNDLEIEVLIIDDGSIDNTNKVIKKIQDQINNLTLQYFYKSNGNWGSVINYVRNNKLAKGEWVTVLDSDDIFSKKTISIFQKYAQKQRYDAIIFDYYKCWKKFLWKIPTYARFRKEIKGELKKQTPFCIPLAKFFKNEVFYQLPKLRENVGFQDAIYTMHALQIANNVFHVSKAGGYYFFKRVGNSMSIPWHSSRFDIEVQICKDLIENNAQEITLVHLLRLKFRNLVDDKKIKFTVKRDFCFSGFSWYSRLILSLMYNFWLKRYFNSSE
ncbi:glycosyltransferase family 2 protein [Mycoplasmoides genitalium]|uniref:glycosyltransferase family 2 protein n=1 Tax=Mycoplasmoides genitalium TaxID=2097 RepID=UPI00027B364D|nr:glycosyltransferase family 2 protein [Mycoplasmoides genitalium]AFQ03364.1 glycosyl transferase, group 2 family protein [Mycoplasmoides genitalium M6282]